MTFPSHNLLIFLVLRRFLPSFPVIFPSGVLGTCSPVASRSFLTEPFRDAFHLTLQECLPFLPRNSLFRKPGHRDQVLAAAQEEFIAAGRREAEVDRVM